MIGERFFLFVDGLATLVIGDFLVIKVVFSIYEAFVIHVLF